ncbi:MAG: hypothetical protein WAJ93_11210 [Candidatus Nitrosopolaris sp.]
MDTIYTCKGKSRHRYCWILFTHAKGSPDIDIFQNDRKHEYNSRSELPAFDKMLSIAKNTIDMCGLDLRIIVLQYISILTLVHKDICVTLLLLNPNSEHVKIQSKNFFGAEDLKQTIENSLRLLCKEKEKLPPNKRKNLVIRVYDYPPQNGIIVIDDGYDNAWIKVEKRPIGSDSNSRPSDAWYKSYDEARYNQYINEYNRVP